MATEMSSLPEAFLANVISRPTFTPREACRLELVSTLFRSAANSDVVWERLLPPDYQDIIATSYAETKRELLEVSSKKQLFMRLADSPILIHAGSKSFFLDKSSGKKCFMIKARDIFIEGDAPMNWPWVPFPSSRFTEVAHLSIARSLKMSLRIEASLLSPKTTYMAYIVFKLRDDKTGLVYIHVQTSVGMTDEVKNMKIINLATEDGVQGQLQFIRKRPFVCSNSNAPSTDIFGYLTNRVPSCKYPKCREDGWLEAELGEVFVDGGDGCSFVEVAVRVMGRGNEKQGFVLEGIEFRPKP